MPDLEPPAQRSLVPTAGKGGGQRGERPCPGPRAGPWVKCSSHVPTCNHDTSLRQGLAPPETGTSLRLRDLLKAAGYRVLAKRFEPGSSHCKSHALPDRPVWSKAVYKSSRPRWEKKTQKTRICLSILPIVNHADFSGLTVSWGMRRRFGNLSKKKKKRQERAQSGIEQSPLLRTLWEVKSGPTSCAKSRSRELTEAQGGRSHDRQTENEQT